MPKLVAVYNNSRIIDCPPEWSEHKDRVGECSVYESENKRPGKRWFYFIYDKDMFTYGYFHCGMGDMEEDEEAGTITFSTRNGEHKYVIEIGEKMPEDYIPYRILGHGDDAVIVAPNGVPIAW